MEHPSRKMKDPADRASSEDKILYKSSQDSLDDCFAISMVFQKPMFQVLISLSINVGT